MSTAPADCLWTGPPEDPSRYRVDLVDGVLVDDGDGGEGLVYQAVLANDAEQRVALKLFTDTPVEAYAQIAAAARLLDGVHHPNVMRQLDCFCGRALGPAEAPPDEDFAVMYSVAEWIDGEPMVTAGRHEGAAGRLRWVSEVAHGLAALHAAHGPGTPNGVVHADVKPSNVRVDRQGHAILIDFGVSRAHDETEPARGMGTYGWRAPELLDGTAAPSPATDAWGAGALAYWALVDDPPGPEPTEALRDRLADRARDKGFANGSALAEHIAVQLDPDPSGRARDLDEWGDELGRLVRRRDRHPWYRRRAPVAVGAAVVGVLVGVGATLLVQSLDADPNQAQVDAGLPGSTVRLARPFAVPESRAGEEVLRQDHVVHVRDGTRVLLSGSRDGDAGLLVNDESEIQVTHPDGAVATYVHNYAKASGCARDEPTGPQDLTALFAPGRNLVRVVIRGGCDGDDVGSGGFAGAGSPVWLTFGSGEAF